MDINSEYISGFESIGIEDELPYPYYESYISIDQYISFVEKIRPNVKCFDFAIGGAVGKHYALQSNFCHLSTKI